jgi:hypothetical protein
MLRKFGLVFGLLLAAGMIAGCGDDKPRNPKGVDGELKPLATPGSPGGEQKIKGKTATPGGTPNSQ